MDSRPPASPTIHSNRGRAIGPLGTAARIAVGVICLLIGGIAGPSVDWAALGLGLVALPALAVLAQLARLSITRTALDATGGLAFCVNIVLFGLLLIVPATSHPTFVFLGASMLLAAWRGYAGCETLAI